MKPIRQPLAVNLESRTNSPLKDARIVNAYVETEGGRKWIIKRPGLLPSLTSPALPTGIGNGLVTFNNKIYAGINYVLYEIIPAGAGGAVSTAGTRALNGRVLNGSKWVHGTSDTNIGSIG